MSLTKMVLALFETPAGFALFRLLDDCKIEDADKVYTHFSDPQKAAKNVQLAGFRKFKSTAEAFKASSAVLESTVSKPLKKFLKKEILKKNIVEKLAIQEPKLAKSISKKLGIDVMPVNANIHELFRGIRANLGVLLQQVPEKMLTDMSLGLSHSLSRYKIKFSPEKVDAMIVQAVQLLDELDKEVNTYSMRAKEWYGWHFPELSKIVTDSVDYAKAVLAMGFRTNAQTAKIDLAEETVSDIVDAAHVSMGTEITKEDLDCVLVLAQQIVDLHEYRTQLYAYLTARMQAIAPNLTALLGELIGARLIAHAGSLMTLAKHPASTIQILGAERALFRALKSKKDTPKYGLLYHATLVGQAQGRNKGKIARLLATKAALSVRVDALSDEPVLEIGLESKKLVESRLRDLENRAENRVNSKNFKNQQQSYQPRPTKEYNMNADFVPFKRPREDDDEKPNKKKRIK